jgi:quaternary ammonium compound-resistance protein SugE
LEDDLPRFGKNVQDGLALTNGGLMAWFYLFLAGVLEVVWAYSMNLSHGFTRPIPSLITLATMTGSFWLLAIAMRTIPLGTAYTVWTGIGSIGAFIVGILMLAEPINTTRIFAVGLILSGLILLKLSNS